MSVIGLLLDFVNVKAWSKEEMQLLEQKYQLVHTEYGVEHGSEDIFFAVLADLQSKWRVILERTREHGPDIDFLNEIATHANWRICGAGKTFAPMLWPDFPNTGIGNKLDEHYLQALMVQADDFRKLRPCEWCGDLFLFHRKTKRHCSDTCRRAKGNKWKIKSGYLKEYQQKKRDEGNPAYFR